MLLPKYFFHCNKMSIQQMLMMKRKNTVFSNFNKNVLPEEQSKQTPLTYFVGIEDTLP